MREIRSPGLMSGDWKRSYGANCDTGSGRKPPVNGTASQPTATAPVVDSTHADASVVEEAGEGRPAVRACSPSPSPPRTRAAGGPARRASNLPEPPRCGAERWLPRRSPLGRGTAVHRALDGEQLVHAPHGLERQGRDHGNLLLSPSGAPRLSMSASSKNLRRAWAQHAASMIGAGLRSPPYSLP